MASERHTLFPDHGSEYQHKLPERYKALRVLGTGGFGAVFKCLDCQTSKIVAVKVSKNDKSLKNEASILTTLMKKRLYQQGIIKFYNLSSHDHALVFECLDTSLINYIYQKKTPMPLSDIRVIIQQLAVAFDALKQTGVIHADVKVSNIMVTDDHAKPLQVKLIDFGLAIFTRQAKTRSVTPLYPYRAPEIILGLPYSEAVDIWSLGCVMAIMLFKHKLFPGFSGFETLKYIVHLVGLPPEHLIEACSRRTQYFTKTLSRQWRLKTYEEYGLKATDRRQYNFRCLDEAGMIHLKKEDMAERTECINLLKAMLAWDEKERITPRQILAHPFITRNYADSTNQATDPGTKPVNLVANPGTEPAPESDPNQTDGPGPGTEPIPKPDTDQVANPGTEPAPESDPNQTDGPGPGTEPIPKPDTDQVANLATEPVNQVGNPGTEPAPESDPIQTDGPGTEPIPKPDTDQVGNPGTESAPESDPNQTDGPGTEPIPKPDTDQVGNPGTFKTLSTSVNQDLGPCATLEETSDTDHSKPKKKNSLQRFLSWCKRTLFPCMTEVDEDDSS